jgi:hypothetical protein
VPIPDKRDLRRFCEIDGWEETEATRPDHHRSRKRLDDGRVLRTKVSHGRGPACNDPGLWVHIWRHQLALDTEQEFWDVLSSGKPSQRGEPEPPPAKPQMEAWLYEYLLYRMGMSEAEILALREDEALTRYLEDIGGG